MARHSKRKRASAKEKTRIISREENQSQKISFPSSPSRASRDALFHCMMIAVVNFIYHF